MLFIYSSVHGYASIWQTNRKKEIYSLFTFKGISCTWKCENVCTKKLSTMNIYTRHSSRKIQGGLCSCTIDKVKHLSRHVNVCKIQNIVLRNRLLTYNDVCLHVHVLLLIKMICHHIWMKFSKILMPKNVYIYVYSFSHSRHHTPTQ